MCQIKRCFETTEVQSLKPLENQILFSNKIVDYHYTQASYII